jgi:hypothetical protein
MTRVVDRATVSVSVAGHDERSTFAELGKDTKQRGDEHEPMMEVEAV